jgi:hypothetical protein
MPRLMRRSLPTRPISALLLSVAMCLPLLEQGASRPRRGLDPAPAGWWETAGALLAEREYHISGTPGELQAPNRAQGFRTSFRNDAVEVRPREPSGSSWRFGWSTTHWGREEALRAVTTATHHFEANRIEYRRGDLIEWYENRPDGLEQGFTIADPPPGSGRLCVVGAVRGNITPRRARTSGGPAIDFLDARGARILRYTGLEVRDAESRRLPAEMAIQDGTVRLLIEDRGAAYPVVVDPVLLSPDWTAEMDSAYASFGSKVSTAGDVNGDGYSDVLVGAPEYSGGETAEGCARLYLGSPNGLLLDHDWHVESDITLGTFGVVSTAGDVNGDGYDDVLVGAPMLNSVFVYLGSAEGLPEEPDQTRSGEQAGSQFGTSVAPAGDVDGDGYDDVIIGAHLYSQALPDQGKAYVYHGSAAGLEATPRWETVGSQYYGRYGYTVATAGDVNGDGFADVIVGAWSDLYMTSNPGYVRVYHGSSSGLDIDPDWTASGESAGHYYAYSVAGAGDVNGDGYSDVVVGAPYYPNAPGDGRAYVYYGSSTGIGEAPAGVHIDCDVNLSMFGYSVATAGDLNGDGYADVVVGAPGYTQDPEGNPEGWAFVYPGSWDGIETYAGFTMQGDQEWAWFGGCVATAGDVNGDGRSDMLVGVPAYDGAASGTGRAVVYHGIGLYPKGTAGWVLESNQEGAEFGKSMAGVGDVNGDGFSDIVVGAPSYDAGQANEGAVFLFLGSRTGPGVLPVWYAEGNQADAYLGSSVAAAGDVNGDGYPDAIVGANRYTQMYEDEGGAFIWLSGSGVPSGTPFNADWRVYGGEAGARLGFSVAGAGDVDGDGFGDVVVGVPYADHPETDEGVAYVYRGSSTGPSKTPDWTLDEDDDYSEYGLSVSTAGDMNGDGYSDVLVGAPKSARGESTEGVAYVYVGSETGLVASTPWWWAESNQVGARLGSSVASAGDVDGDRFSDVIIGAPRYNYGSFTDNGAAFLWGGAYSPPPTGTPDNADCDLWINQDYAWFGYSVASAGDANGDGYGDFMAGSYLYDVGTALSMGTVMVIGGGPEWRESFLWWHVGDQAGGYWGWAIASAGDVNGDGFGDILVGAPDWNNGQTDEGRAFLYFGNDSRGLPRLPRQMRTDLSAPIAPLGVSDSETGFRLEALARTPLGRGSVRMEWEVEPSYAPFDGEPDGTTDWVDTGTPVAPGGSRTAVGALVTGLTPGWGHRWRLRLVSDHPYFPRTPWFSLPDNSHMETDFRTAGATIGVADGPRPTGTEKFLGIVAPNPFRGWAEIPFTLPAPALVRLTVHDVQGRIVRTLLRGPQETGEQRVRWDGRDDHGRAVSSGLYFVTLAVGDRVETARITVLR